MADERPMCQQGDDGAERRLYQALGRAFVLPGLQQTGMAARTRFFDDEIVRAIERGVDQVVVLGAGYDGRALRFGGDGVRWIEVDHPGTQSDKRRLLTELGMDHPHLRFAAVDLITDDLDSALSDAGHASARPTLFLCEGLVAYLPFETSLSLWNTLRRRSHADSVLAANFRVAPVAGVRYRLLPMAVDSLLAMIGEHRRMKFRPGDPEHLFRATGWTIVRSESLAHDRLDGDSQFVAIAGTPSHAAQ